MLFITICSVYFFKDATALVKMDNKLPSQQQQKTFWMKFQELKPTKEPLKSK